MSGFQSLDLSNFYDSIANKAAENSNRCEGDYTGEDGLLRCGKCHGKKQSRQIHPFKKTEVILNCVCECEQQRREEERLKIEQEKEFMRIKRMKSELIQDKEIRSWTFAADDGTSPMTKHARTYVNNWQQMYDENTGLLLYGDVGTGKTFFAACIANHLIDNGVPVLVTNFTKLVNQLSGFKEDKNAFLNSLNAYKLLIIDDLGVERQSEYVMELVYSVIDSRYKSGKPMIITTNLPISEIRSPKNMEYKRIYDRIMENCIPMQFMGESRRKQASTEKMKRARELFR